MSSTFYIIFCRVLKKNIIKLTEEKIPTYLYISFIISTLIITFQIKNNADGIIFLRNKLKVLWKKNNMDSNLLNTKVHHNH